ncbi:hypothetical protein E1301_Tti002257 [Triplophysa tibetana]|uniref:Uncharacterized protein n=1 Tax=Triplophysa tibetana TaxID=1572043 RepID=A0A5A9NET1_9TELE|nr:hypothetical protein E1301_Tti002257 [Triplophysa tibetana]
MKVKGFGAVVYLQEHLTERIHRAECTQLDTRGGRRLDSSQHLFGALTAPLIPAMSVQLRDRRRQRGRTGCQELSQAASLVPHACSDEGETTIHTECA